VPHGAAGSNTGTLMMTRIEMDKRVFVHASDIQLLDDPTVDRVIDWQPDIVLAAGPPLYLDRLGKTGRKRAWGNAMRLLQGIEIVILDHHLMRSKEGAVWLDELAAAAGRRVYCAADFMGRPRRLLEAERAQLYAEMPVPRGWHDDYARGRVDTGGYFDAMGYSSRHSEIAAS
jgi:predicted metallo-beta-lactamase superfamily hydrolase